MNIHSLASQLGVEVPAGESSVRLELGQDEDYDASGRPSLKITATAAVLRAGYHEITLDLEVLDDPVGAVRHLKEHWSEILDRAPLRPRPGVSYRIIGTKLLIERARGGDREAAEALLRLFTFGVDEGLRDSDLDRYLSEAFQEILAGNDPSPALGVKRGRGESRSRDQEAERRYLRDSAIAADVAERLEQGTSLADALVHVGEDWKAWNEGREISDRQVRRIVRKHRPDLL